MNSRQLTRVGQASLVGALLILIIGGCQTAPRNSLATHNSSRWENAIATYEAQDVTNRPAPGCVVFTGSSFIRLWTNLVADFPGLPVVNRGFGGCHLADVHNFADRIVIPYAPRQVVIYAGGNDITSGKSPEAVFGDFVALCKKLRAALPGVDIAFISCPPSPKRWSKTDEFRRVNALIADYCHRNGMTYINAFDRMLGEDGLPLPDIYGEDQLHMNAQGYAIWREVVAPHLK